MDSDEPEALASRSLEVEVGIRDFQLPRETRLQDPSADFFDVVGLEFQPHGSGASQEFAFVRDIPIEKPRIEIVSEANEVPFRIGSRDLATEDIAIELADAVAGLSRDEH
jgi:hypothetical protein